MEELTVGDIRPLLSLIANNPLLDDSQGLASQLRGLLESLNVPITPELDQSLTLIEANPVLIDAGVAEFRAAIEGLPDSTLLSDVPGFGSGSGGDTPSDPDPVLPTDPITPIDSVDDDGNQIASFTLPFSETTIDVSGDTVVVTIPGQEAQTLVGLDRLEFDDGTYYLDVQQEPGLLKGAYDALLGRDAPDAAGFDFWLDLLEGDTVDLFALTESFAKTDSFAQQYGSFLSDTNALLDEIYLNLFNRAVDDTGRAFWSDYLETNGVADTVDEAFAYMLQSDEFKTVVGTSLDNGFFI